MDKFVYRGILIACALVLSVALIITPVLAKMYLVTHETEVRVRLATEKLERKLKELERKERE
jgi:uncharacterized membrane protein YciS (DUF1049 family)